MSYISSFLSMDGLINSQVIFSLVIFIFTWSSDARFLRVQRDLQLDNLHDPLLSATFYNFLEASSSHQIEKRSSDWSKRKRPLSISHEAHLETQASDMVEVPVQRNNQVPRQRSFKNTQTSTAPQIETSTDLHTSDEGTSEVKPVIKKFISPKNRRPFTFKPKLKEGPPSRDNPVVIKPNPKIRKPLFENDSKTETQDFLNASKPQVNDASKSSGLSVDKTLKEPPVSADKHNILEPQTSDKIEVSASPEDGTYRKQQRQPVSYRTRNKEAQESRNNAMTDDDSETTKPPRIVRKMRFQNVPLSSRRQLSGENTTSTVEKNGRVVRVKKFKRKTTLQPSISTTTPTTTTRRPQIRNTPSSEFSHITVINKEIRDQKPRRKNKTNKQPSLWVPEQGFGARNSDESTASSFSEMPLSKQQNALENQPVKPRITTKESDTYLSYITPSSSGEALNSGFANYVQPDRAVNSESKDLERDSSENPSNTSSDVIPKSVDPLSNLFPYDLNTPPPPYMPVNSPSFTTLPPFAYTPQNQPFQNFGFPSFQGGPGFRDYLQSDPFFNRPFPQPPGMSQQPSLGQPFYGRSSPQYPYQPANGPGHHRSGGLDFDPSPRLLSLRRSVMEGYASDEEPVETATEFSIPKFEVPPIDFNDKGCRTVYKEVSHLPEGRETTESKAKSFVLTRECFFPEGVPTTTPSVGKNDQVSPGAEYA